MLEYRAEGLCRNANHLRREELYHCITTGEVLQSTALAFDTERRLRLSQDEADRPRIPPEERRRRKLVRRHHVVGIAAAWVITVPATALISALVFWLLGTLI